MATVINRGITGSKVDGSVARHGRTSGKSFSITPSDTVNFTNRPRSIYVGGGGNLAVVNTDNTVSTFVVQSGSYIDVNAKRVNATGTTATGLIGML